MRGTNDWLRLLLCFQAIFVVNSRGFSFPWNTKSNTSSQKNEERLNHNGSCLSRAEAHAQLQAFLQERENETPSLFHIQGWRWHTMSLAREAERLHQLTVRRCNDTSAVTRAVNYVVGFNMKALHRIEKELFFPWVRQQVQTKNPAVGSALMVVMDQLEELRTSVAKLGSQLVIACQVYRGLGRSRLQLLNVVLTLPFLLRQTQDAARVSSSSTAAIQSIGERSAQVAEQTRSMLHLENAYLVPTLARLIPEAEQKAFNNQVIRNLGIWDSRLHLVSMYEAIVEDPVELALFEQTIPSIPRKMIPRWKRLLYQPAAGDLDL